MDLKYVLGIVVRYFLIVVMAVSDFFLFYFVFTPLTTYPVFWVLSVFSDATFLGGAFIMVGGVALEIVKACVGGSAYYLLMFLNFSTEGIDFVKRVKMLGLAFGSLLLFNVFRIVVLTFVYFESFAFFDVTHLFFWYFMSFAFVLGVWFFEVRYFKVKGVPVYSDVKSLVRRLKRG